jgi:hypothetical protein
MTQNRYLLPLLVLDPLFKVASADGDVPHIVGEPSEAPGTTGLRQPFPLHMAPKSVGSENASLPLQLNLNLNMCSLF